uniref:ABC-2 type transporter transmembrane domain-containing protein n=1 Tax=Denticeps clupeoides TaxID=299321 RepID=A0AAY4B7W4_9TELE
MSPLLLTITLGAQCGDLSVGTKRGQRGLSSTSKAQSFPTCAHLTTLSLFLSLSLLVQWVLAFEIFIPLVLFFILLGLRQKKPAIPVKEAYYSAAPLTSAGIIPIMQSLCPDGQRDEFGFLQYKNSTVTQLLERISEVVEQNHLFTSDRPGLGEELESLQQHLESLSSAQSPLESHFNTSFTVGSILKNQSVFQQFLVRNLSLANDTASLLLSSPVNLKEVRLHTHTHTRTHTHISALYVRDTGVYFIFILGHSDNSIREGILLTGSVLEGITCEEGSNSELGKILLVPEEQQSALQAYRSAMCRGGPAQRAERFGQISQELRDQIDTQNVIEKLRLEQANASGLPSAHLGALLKDLADVERLLRDVDLLSGLARLLPKGACAGHQPPPVTNTSTFGSNTTTWGPNTTEGSSTTDGEDGGVGSEAENPRTQFSAFVQLWAGLQPILCGNNRIIEPEALKQGNMSSLGFTSKEQRNLGLLVHLMTTNPKILYSPIGSQVDKVIQKANETFAFVGNVTHYARLWLNISSELRTFLEEGKLNSHLAWLQQFTSDLRRHPELLNASNSELMQSLLEGNFSLPNTTTLLEQLDTIDNAACGWTSFMSKVSVDIFKGFPDEESIVNYTLNQAYHDNVSVFASVIFQTKKDGSLPPHVMYKIRQNSSFTEKTNEIRRAYWRPGPNNGGKFYFLYGFVWIQDMMERAIINTFVGHDVVEPGNYVQMFPYPCYTRDDFLFVIEHMMPLCMVISWVYSVAMMIQHIVAEKEHRLKEVMKMMGLNNAVHWVAWFITGFVQLSISVTALTAILKYGRVLLHSDPFIIWLFLTIYAVATIMFCFLVSVIYSKAKLASACGGIIYFLSYVPYMYVAIREEVAHDKITAFEKCIASLMSTTAFGLGSKYFALYEVAGVGIQWRTINQSPVEGDDFNLLLSMVMLIIDATVYGVLTWYIEAVHPGFCYGCKFQQDFPS